MVKKERPAFVIITAVLMVGASIWLLLIAQAALHLNEAFMNNSWALTSELNILARGCTEMAYRGILLDRFYGGENLSLGSSSCIIELRRSSDDYQIVVRARSGDYYKKIQASVTLNAGHLTVNAWQEAE